MADMISVPRYDNRLTYKGGWNVEIGSIRLCSLIKADFSDVKKRGTRQKTGSSWYYRKIYGGRKMKTRKIMAFVMAMLMMLSLAACGSSGDDAKADGTGTDGTRQVDGEEDIVELRWLNKCESEAEAAIWQQLADNVTKEYPNIKITIENTDWTSYWTKLPVELASGNAPDLMYMHFSRASDYKDSMLPLGEYIKDDEKVNMGDFYSGILDCFTFDDEVYAFPYDFGPYVMYYNKDLFDKYKLEYPDEETDWEEFMEICEKLSVDGNYGTVFCSSCDYYIPQVLSLGGEIIDEKGTFEITDKETTDALQTLADLINVQGYAPKIADTANTVWNWEQFEAGNIGMLIDGPWCVSNVINYCDFNVGYTIVPAAQRHVTTINGSGLAVSNTTKHPKEAYLALQSLTGPAAQQILAENGRALPSRESVRDYYYEAMSEQDGLEEAIRASLDIGIPYHVTENFSEVSTILNSGMDVVFSGEAAAKEAAKDIQAQVDALLK